MMECPFISDVVFEDVSFSFECPNEVELDDPNSNFCCLDCPHYQCLTEYDDFLGFSDGGD